ncbi:hypothetical protein HELRODRAFT_185922 [Helobdella robusta]|uniref:SOCS box domain-containing protein n=1 Tax=Helobdella robusta TaxID=6412 RepID=T1FNG0_HELRO|nr:hypothetical protein HELRODRAFT_185922 [Helobdella robusta]ESN97214.1 hypothetical protein HELRODRAFT_185922 [Helobdella robusta]
MTSYKREVTTVPLGEKVAIMGQFYSGKTCLNQRIIRGVDWCDRAYEATIGTAYGTKFMEVGDFKIKLGIWDTAGSERFLAISRNYYRNSGAIIVCYDITSLESYNKAVEWWKKLLEEEKDSLLYLCGNKKDLVLGPELKYNRRVDFHDAREFAEDSGGKFFETSSKTGEGVVELMTEIAKDLIEKKKRLGEIEPDRLVLEHERMKMKKANCSNCLR